jgi:hypothetical protein
MDKVQEHIEKVREALQNYPSIDVILLDGTPESEAYDAVDENKLVWLQQSLDIIEQQQREIERLRAGISRMREEIFDWHIPPLAMQKIGRIEKELLSPNKEVSTDV